MTQPGSTPHKSSKPLGFHRYVTDAISDWEAIFQRKIQDYEDECEARGQNSVPLYPGVDPIRSDMLKQLIDDFFVSFDSWCPEEVLVFALIACPRENLVTLTREGRTSQFLAVLHDSWRPSFLDWAYFLWELTGRACELFADILYLLPNEQRPNKALIGKVLFKDMVERELVHPRACASFIGALMPYPYESTYARKQEETIESLSKLLGPTEIGLICRSLILYRSRDPKHCDCGYKRGQFECTCGRNPRSEDSVELVSDPLAHDLDKEYARVLLNLILDRNGVQVLEDEYRWTQDDRDEFVRSACEEVFSEAIYTEIYQNLHLGKEPVVKQRSPRQITDIERKTNVTRSFDHDYDRSMAQHGGCVSRGCKQAMKVGCANISCKQHCRSAGVLLCKAHRMYSVKPLPSKPQRKNIKMPDERYMSGSRFVEAREGEI